MVKMIEVDNIGKRYLLGGQDLRFTTLRDRLTAAFTRPFSRSHRESAEEFWALRNVSFSVNQGEVIGIIGKNGAGKSTLLKVLSRITRPTEGSARIFGRIASLLEVGTGFHPELTGRENIFLSGNILGMARSEIKNRFDEIVGFAEIGRFLDTPVKHYSSGMYVRLGFAVAAHLNPEILLIDEVLAVGDIEFQKKCLGKMNEVASSGRTVLFVSHNLAAVTSLCQRALVLEAGRKQFEGGAEEAVAHYRNTNVKAVSAVSWSAENAPTNGIASLLCVRMRTMSGETGGSFDIRKPIGIEIEFSVLKPGFWFTPVVHVFNESGVFLFNSVAEVNPDWDNLFNRTGRYRSVCWIPGNFLAEGLFTVRVVLWGFTRPPTRGVVVDEIVRFTVFDNLDGDSVRGRVTGSYPGLVRPKLDWCTEWVSENEEPCGEHRAVFSGLKDHGLENH